MPTLVHALADPSAKVTLAAAPPPPPAPGSTSPPRHCGTAASQLAAVLWSAIPFGSAAAAALALGASSEASGERHRHIGVPLLLGGVAFLALPGALTWVGPAAAFVCVVGAVIAADATTGPFWTWVHLAAPPGGDEGKGWGVTVARTGRGGGRWMLLLWRVLRCSLATCCVHCCCVLVLNSQPHTPLDQNHALQHTAHFGDPSTIACKLKP